jgi:hypothetical protein
MRKPPSLFSSVLERRPAVPEAERFDPPLRSGERVRQVALLVAHGMGQQVRYETLSAMVDVLRRGQWLATKKQSPAGAYLVPWEHDYIARAELHLRAQDGTPHEVHVYEAYWAPLAVGRITTLETFQFLLAAGWRGQRRISSGRFSRFMFGRWYALKIGPLTRISLLLASVLLALLAVMNAVVLAAATSRVLTGGTSRWMSVSLLQDLTIDFGLFVLLAGLLVVLGVGVPALARAALRKQALRKQARREEERQAQRTKVEPDTVPPAASAVGPAGEPDDRPLAVSTAGMRLVFGALAVTLLAGLSVIFHVAGHGLGRHWLTWAGTPLFWLVAGLAEGHSHWWQWLVVVLIWGAVLALSWRVRYFLREYVGDVAIYVSSNALNRFAETREAIQEVVGQVARCVYSQKEEAAPGREGAKRGPLYDRVVVVGHSLGSVVAYDVLNEMLRAEIYKGQSQLKVRERTHALITFGSPLDKTAFIFRQQTKENLELRETFAAAWQPLIRKYLYRPPRWINLFSKMDWISGRLTYYDKSAEPLHTDDDIAVDPGRKDDPKLEPERHVTNLADPEATTPLAAHNEYWDGELLARTVFEQIICADPPPSSGGDEEVPATA